MTRMRIYDFKISGYFPWHVMAMAVGLAFFGFMFLSESIAGSITMLLISLVILTTHYRLRIDFGKKEFHDYLWIAGFKSGYKGTFESIEYLFIKRSQVSQTMGLKAATSTIRKEVFDAYLKFSEDEKVHLLTKDNKKNLINKLRDIANTLQVKIVDYSEGETRIVE